MDMYRIHDMLEDVSEVASTELSKGANNVNTKEFGEVVDMIKDLSEAEKNKMQACYYKTIIEAMENSEYGEDYDWSGPDEDRMGYDRMRRGYRARDSRGRYAYSDRMKMMPEILDDRMSYSNGGGMRTTYSTGGSRGSRYGYSHDKYMSDKSMYSSNDPEGKSKREKIIEDRMDDLYGMFKEEIQDMSQEEKQMWKAKLNKIINL